MSNRELPFMPWFPDQFDAATKGWTFIARAAYRALLDAQWQLGVLPQEHSELSLTIGMRARDFARVWPRLASKFPITDGGRKNPRLEEHRVKSLRIKNAKSEGGRKGNAIRWKSDSDTDSRAIGNGSPLSLSPSDKKEHPQPPQGGRNGLTANGRRKPRGERDRSLNAWREITWIIDDIASTHSLPPDQQRTWADVGAHCNDTAAVKAAEKVGFRLLADRDKFNTTDLQGRFRDAYERFAAEAAH